MAAAEKKTTEKIKPILKAHIIKAENPPERAPTKAMEEDPFTKMYDQHKAIVPPFDLLTLAMMPENCAELNPALDTMSVNIEKLGYRVLPRPNVHEQNEDIPADVMQQAADARNFFDNAVLDQDIGSLDELRARLRRDLETTGNAYIEVIPKLGEPSVPAGLNHLPSWTMRLRKQDDYFTDYDVPRAVKDANGSWQMKDFPTSKRFRRFVQIRESGSQAVYFKEWSDPRNIRAVDGEESTGALKAEEAAHEVIHLKLYSPRSPYGLPRWIGHLFAIYGTRAAEEINYMTFENNQIPAMALLATNVAVTQGSIERMREFIEERVQGNKNYATILMLEAEPTGEGMKDPGAMKLELKPLTEFQHADAMFQNYITMNNEMIRRAFRLPPIFVGRSEDYNRAVAEASRKLAEEQIFFPERKSVDRMFTDTIIARLGYASVCLKSNTPNVTDNFELTQLLATAERSGGLTPRVSNHIVADVIGEEIPEPVADIKPDQPFTLTMMEKGYELQGAVPQVDGAEKKLKKEDNTDVVLHIQRILERDDQEGILTDIERMTLLRFIQS